MRAPLRTPNSGIMGIKELCSFFASRYSLVHIPAAFSGVSIMASICLMICSCCVGFSLRGTLFWCMKKSNVPGSALRLLKVTFFMAFSWFTSSKIAFTWSSLVSVLSLSPFSSLVSVFSLASFRCFNAFARACARCSEARALLTSSAAPLVFLGPSTLFLFDFSGCPYCFLNFRCSFRFRTFLARALLRRCFACLGFGLLWLCYSLFCSFSRGLLSWRFTLRWFRSWLFVPVVLVVLCCVAFASLAVLTAVGFLLRLMDGELLRLSRLLF